jgi:hypothetical protein
MDLSSLLALARGQCVYAPLRRSPGHVGPNLNTVTNAARFAASLRENSNLMTSGIAENAAGGKGS